MVKTRKVKDRRQLRFGRMQEILQDVERLASNGPESIRTLGNWTPAQNVCHIALFIRGSLDGFDFRAPWLIRAVGRMLKARALNRPMRSGFKQSGNMSSMAPKAQVTWNEAIGLLRMQVERIERGDRMNVPSPLFGTLSHEEWIQLHCRHAELHLSFLRPPG